MATDKTVDPWQDRANLQAMRNALVNLTNAAINLADSWAEIADAFPGVDKVATTGYPFADSLEDVAAKIDEWASRVRLAIAAELE